MSITLAPPLTTDDDLAEPVTCAGGCGETENLHPETSACRDCMREWRALPDARFYDYD